MRPSRLDFAICCSSSLSVSLSILSHFLLCRLPARDSQLAEIEKSNGVDKLEQQVRDALFARTTAHLGEHRILKSAFNRFDKDASGSVDIHEFEKALEHLGLHTADGGLPGAGGLPTAVVHGLFYRYDTDGSGHVDYEEFCAAVLQEDRMHKML